MGAPADLLWLAFLLWMARKDVRDWRGVMFLALLAAAAETAKVLSQGAKRA